jgi:tetratricopeptide (TPR) repeat protein
MNKTKVFLISFLCIFFLISSSNAQDMELQRKIDGYMVEAKSLMKRGKYDEANSVFRKILATNYIIPTDMCYLFAETLFMVGQYENSKNFLDKYKKLAGKAGDYYDQSLQLEEMLDEKLNVIKQCKLCDVRGYIYSTCETCKGTGSNKQHCHYCKGKGKVQCTVCRGEGVAIGKNKLGEREYKSCTKCEAKGIMNCPICNGEKEYEDYCKTCLGSSKVATKTICKHPKDL